MNVLNGDAEVVREVAWEAETTWALWRRLREESLVPFTNMPAANDLVEDEGIASCELLGGLAGREDRHRPFLLRVAERPVHEQHAAVMEFLAARSMGLEVCGRLRKDVLSRVVEEYVLHGGQSLGDRGLLFEPHDLHAGWALDNLMAVMTKLSHPLTGERGDRQQVCFAVPLAVGKRFEKLGVDRHLSPSLDLGAEG
jgi:hypothetical protein